MTSMTLPGRTFYTTQKDRSVEKVCEGCGGKGVRAIRGGYWHRACWHKFLLQKEKAPG